MAGAVPYILAGWVVVVAGLFRVLPGRPAAAVGLVGGWAVLPVASYTAAVMPEHDGGVSPMHALALPTAFAWNKATAVGLACLVGAVLFDWPTVRALRPRWGDLPMFAWCLVPLPAAAANGLDLAAGLGQARYNLLAWGVPYAMGRVYFADAAGLRSLLVAWTVAGLAGLPAVLAEFVRGPFLYEICYGPHPYRFDGAGRPVGHRPLLFLEHGNQLGTWVTLAAAAGIGLWRSGRGPRHSGWVAAVLVGQALLCQSHGAILLLVLALPWLLGAGPTRWKIDRGAALSLGLTGLVVAASLIVAGLGPLRSRVRSLFHGLGKSSFTWRLARYEESLSEAARRPVLGHARANWSPRPGGTFDDPAALGLGMTGLGMYGAAGLLAIAGILAWPVVRVLASRPGRGPEPTLLVASAALLAIAAGDALLNSTLILPVLATAGGLVGVRLDARPGERPTR